MLFYELNLAVFVTVVTVLFYQQYRAGKPVETLLGDAASREQHLKKARKFVKEFFPVYGLAVAADWLQVRNGAYSGFAQC